MTGTDPQPEDVFEIERIRRLVELMEQHDLSEVDLRQERQRIRLRRGATVEPLTRPLSPAAAASTPPAPLVVPGQRSDDDARLVLIKSPMVGTFYSRPNPDAQPFVRVGDRISSETTVCIIEAMKVFNEIPAEVSGTIVAILAEDEEPVEFGKPLFKVDTSK
jgi:acetyl-CoA carboxylase biotin carboxyl carrier protein